MRKNVLKPIVSVILLILALFAAVLLFYTIREYRPKAKENVEVSDGTRVLEPGDTFSVLTYNTGYACLSYDQDFFMDGGSMVRPDNRELVEQNLAGIISVMKQQSADCYFLQEVDRDSYRTYHIDQLAYYESALGWKGMYACNFRCDFVPYPFPPIGKVDSGLFTMTGHKVSKATRIALPESFSWPIKTCNLKRCMLEVRIPIEGSKKELVLINFHLEAYDNGEGKIAQSKMLSEKLEEEYAKGNYVIAGGDFNQTFEGMETYPILPETSWVPNVMEEKDIPEHFSFAVSDNVPTCRLLNAPYSGNYLDSQVFVIDGYIVSDNLDVIKVQTIDTDFRWADHQPVRLEVILKDR